MRGAVDPHEQALSPDELAGLALEPDVEARLIRPGPKSKAEVLESPFEVDDLTSLPASDWTLLVQDVDKHLPALAGFLDGFDFIPGWRFDDLMISVAASGGGVGPHIDQYDVFLCQMQGHRRWELGAAGEHAELKGTALRQIAAYDVTETFLLAPGDVLYLPPGIPHDGVAEDLCSTWSVGFRAPTAAELVTGLMGSKPAPKDALRRYADPDLTITESDAGLIGAQAIKRFRDLLGNAVTLDDKTFALRLGEFLTRQKAWLEPLVRDEPMTIEDFTNRIRSGETLYRHGMALFARADIGSEQWLFVSGKARRVTGSETGVAKTLCSQRMFASADSLTALVDGSTIGLVHELYNDGQLLLESDWETDGDEIPG